ncbi:Granulins protein, partial [Clarias magur]
MEWQMWRFYNRNTLENILSREKNAAEVICPEIYTLCRIMAASWLASMLTSKQSALTDPYISSQSNNN